MSHTIKVDFNPNHYDLLVNLVQHNIDEAWSYLNSINERVESGESYNFESLAIAKQSLEDLVALKIALKKGKDFF